MCFNQYYKSKKCDDILNIISQELDVKRNIHDLKETYLNWQTEHFKIFENEYENQLNDYRHENEDEKLKNINEKLSQLPVHQLMKQMKLDELMWDFDGVSLYFSAMWDEKSIYPGIETG